MFRARHAVAVLLVVAAASTFPSIAPIGAADQTAPELAAALQRKYDSVKDFSADFTHTYQGGVLRKKITERGHLVVKKPGKMRWEYSVPEPKQFVSDGMKMYSYIPQDKQVIVASVPPENEATTPALFLTGKGDIARDFIATYAETAPAGAPAMPPGTTSLKLTPRRSEPEYEYLVVAIDPVTFQIRALTTRDRQGGDSTLTFTNLKENQGISDKEFAFRVPRGVDVITDGTRN